MDKNSPVFKESLKIELEIQNSPRCPKLYQPKLHQDTRYSTTEDSVWAVKGAASDFGPSSRYIIVRSVYIMA